ncbi:MAG: hypothetical protein GX591_01035 [Planctomycetes bacterium]|nr:hypothetical protein [Planctomycetota bacterium]
MDRKHRVMWPAVALAAVLTAGAAAPESRPASAPAAYGPGRTVATLEQDAIRESSGLAASRRHADVLWTHNDSGDLPRLFAFDLRGRHVGTYLLRGAISIDWEDMASAVLDGLPTLIVADVGDNGARRSAVRLYLATEPDGRATTQPAEPFRVRRTIVFTYADGPRDCEAVAVDPTEPAVYLIDKQRRPSCGVYRLPLAPPSTQPSAKPAIERIATLGHSYVTAMDISPDGRRAVVGTYTDAFEYTRRADESWADAFARPPRRISLPPRRQGESLCYGSDGATLYATSEKTPTPLIEVRPAGKADEQ